MIQQQATYKKITSIPQEGERKTDEKRYHVNNNLIKVRVAILIKMR